MNYIVVAVGTLMLAIGGDAQGIFKITEPMHNAVITDSSGVRVSWIVDSYAADRRIGFHYWIGCGVLDQDGNVVSIRPNAYVSAPQGSVVVSLDDTRRFESHDGVAAIVLLRVDDPGNKRYLSWLRQGRGTPRFPADVSPSVSSRVIVRFGEPSTLNGGQRPEPAPTCARGSCGVLHRFWTAVRTADVGRLSHRNHVPRARFARRFPATRTAGTARAADSGNSAGSMIVMSVRYIGLVAGD